MSDFEVTDFLCTPAAEDAAVEAGMRFATASTTASQTAVNIFHFSFTTPWLTSPRKNGGHPSGANENSSSATESRLLLPVRANLSQLTVSALVDVFVARLRRRYGGAVPRPARLLLRHSPSSMEAIVAADLPGSEEAERIYAQMTLGGRQATRAYPSSSLLSAGPPSALASAAGAAAVAGKDWHQAAACSSYGSPAAAASVDAVMNAGDTLDCFIPPPLLPRSARVAGAGPPLYNVLVEEWSDFAVAAEGDRKEMTTAGGSGQCALRHGACGGSSESDSQQLRLRAAAVALPQAQRSTYVDLFLHRRSMGIGIAGGGSAGFLTSDGEVSDVDRDNDSDTDRVVTIGGTLMGGARAQEVHAARLALAETEQTARERCALEEADARALVTGLHDDSMQSRLAVEALRGYYAADGRLAELLRKHRAYPSDTQPLVPPVSALQRARLMANADNTALLSFQFLDAKPRVPKTEDQLRQEEMRARYLTGTLELDAALGIVNSSSAAGADTGKGYRAFMEEAVAHERAVMAREEREQLRVAYFQQMGKPLPPREPTPPPPPRAPMTPFIEDLPEEVFSTAMDAYSEGRRVIVRDERVTFRSTTQAMASILARQAEADAAAVARGYREELAAAEKVFSFDFASFNSLGDGIHAKWSGFAAAPARPVTPTLEIANAHATSPHAGLRRPQSTSSRSSSLATVDEEGAHDIFKFPAPRNAFLATTTSSAGHRA